MVIGAIEMLLGNCYHGNSLWKLATKIIAHVTY